MASSLPPDTPTPPEPPAEEPLEMEPDRFHRLKMVALAVLIPAAMLLGYHSFLEYQAFQVATTHLEQAALLGDQNQNQAALNELEHCLAAYPEFYEAYNLMATLHNQSQDLDGAAKAYRRGLAAMPEHGLMNLNMAEVLVAQQDYAEALTFAQKASRLLPGDDRPGMLIEKCNAGMTRKVPQT